MTADRTVHFFATCLADQFRPESALAAARVLEEAGCDVRFDPRQTCCGQPALNLGHLDEARTVAARTLGLYEGTEGPIVVPSGSCATTMAKLYPGLFAGTPHAEQAAAFAARVLEWSAFVVHTLGWRPAARLGLEPVAVHHACHGLRELGLVEEARILLEAAGHPLVELPGADECCGFGGAFSVLMPEMSGRILRTKLDNIETAVRQGARTIASLDAGCLMQMASGHERKLGCAEGDGPCPRYRHVAELLAGGDDAPPS